AGFAAGVAGGFVGALVFFQLAPAGWNEAQQFLAVAAVSLVASIVTTFATAPVPADVLRAFYVRVAPFGFWPKDWRAPYRREHRGDLIRGGVALVWQVLTFL